MQWASKMFEGATKMVALPPSERAFLVLAWAMAPIASALLAKSGFEGALRTLARTSGHPRRANRAEPVGVERAESLVKSAFIRQAATRGCLPQSIVQFLLHRRFGPTPRLVIGVARTAPTSIADSDLGWGLDAHAWVEHIDGPSRCGAWAPIVAYSDDRGIWRETARDEARA